MHIADVPHQQKLARTANLIEDLGFAVDADASNETELLAAIETKGALKHISDRQHIPQMKRAVELIQDISASSVTGDDLTDMTDALPDVGGANGRFLH